MIQEKERLQFESLLALIYDLQQENWPYQDLSREAAFSKIVQLAQILGVELDPNDPEFLPLMIEKVAEISMQPATQEAPSLPPNLDELVEIYEREEAKKVDELQKKITSQEIYQRLQKFGEKSKKLKEEKVLKEAEKIVEEEFQKVKEEAAIEIPNKPAVDNYQRYQNLNEEFTKIIHDIDPETPSRLVEKMAQNAADKIITSLPPLAQPDFFTKEIETQVLQEAEKIVDEEFQKIKSKEVLKEAEKIINNEFKRIKKETNKGGVQNFITEAKEIAATPAIIRPFQEFIKPVSPFLEETLPQAILDKLAQAPETVSFRPIYTILNPKAAAAAVEKTVYTLPVNLLKMSAEKSTPEWQTMINQGIFYEDFQTSIKYLEELGVPKNHPVLLKLADKAARFKEQQKIEYKDKKGNVYYKDTRAAEILKHYYRFDKKTGRLKTDLPRLSPGTDWVKSGYSNFLKRGLDRFRFLTRGYEKFSKFVTKGQYTSFFTPVKQFISKKFAQPVVQWLAKTAVGKAAKAGVKKAAGWLAVKLGVKMGIRAAAIAAAPESAGISLLIGLAIEAGTWLLGKIKNAIVGIINDPEKALMAIGIGAVVLVFASMPIALLGIIPIVFGGLGLAGLVLAPVTLGAIGGGLGGFFAFFAVAPIVFPVALFFIILLSVLAALTLFIVLIASGAFILPQSVPETPVTTISPYSSPYFNLTKTASVTHLENNQLPTTITYTITIQPKGNYVLIQPQITEEITVSKKDSSPQLEPCDFSKLPEKITQTEVLTCEKNLNILFADSAVVNVVNLSTGVDGIPGVQQGIATAVVIIGKPPGECPSGWPINANEAPEAYISQGPQTQCFGCSHQGDEAVDISVYKNTNVYATHEGYVVDIFSSSGGGKTVRIQGRCNGIDFVSEYLHLNSYVATKGQLVTKGSLIAKSGNTGNNTTGPHLDYRFKGLLMAPPFIPKDIKGCTGPCGKL